MTGFSISMDLTPKETQSEHDRTQTGTVEQRLKHFMRDVTGRALVMMENATQGQQGIAMDLVQEAFISLHKSYADKSIEEWYPLFYTILNNKLQDWRRKETRRIQPFSFFKKISLKMMKTNLILQMNSRSTHPKHLHSWQQQMKFKQLSANYLSANNRHLC